eukprot:TRINITY_DN6727_c0_g1_i1.p2 TRINITY_DN6727_c0_g1~~TRINITY_DN6727_c0_g1_i1.p2  ORF type:complete len:133 (-),score=13.11 TRINITY_DN6727_c0_g1_i1:97-495(-)
MSPMAVEMEGQMWNPFEYSMGSWSGAGTTGLMGNDLPLHLSQQHHYGAGLTEHDYGTSSDFSLLSGLGSPFSTYSIKRCQGFVRCDMDNLPTPPRRLGAPYLSLFFVRGLTCAFECATDPPRFPSAMGGRGR